MTKLKLLLQQIKPASIFSLVAISFIPGQAQPIQHKTLLSESLIFDAPTPPSGIGQPITHDGGGPRGCKLASTQSNKQLTALVPATGWGLTTMEHPTLWFYVPFLPSSTLSGEFVLQDDAGNSVSPKSLTFTLSGTPGIVKLSLLAAPSLDINKRYHWFFNIYCEPNEPPIYLDGWIQRSQITPATAKNRFWYDVLNDTINHHQNKPEDTRWTELLKAVHLESIAREQIVECCKLKNQ